MESHEYKIMFDMETHYWWYVGLHQLVLYYLGQTNTGKSRLEILDAGCGTGRLMKLCDSTGLEPIGLDLSREALRFSRVRGLRTLVQGTISEIPFRNAQFDVVVSLDVADCLEGHEIHRTFCEMHRVLKRGGHLILNLPAYNSLRSQHDLAQHILHRFRAEELGTLLSEVGFQLHLCTYRNTFLFPVAAVVRLLRRHSAPGQETLRSDLKPLPHLINAVLTSVLALENSIIRAGLYMPLGLSVFCVAEKPA